MSLYDDFGSSLNFTFSKKGSYWLYSGLRLIYLHLMSSSKNSPTWIDLSRERYAESLSSSKGSFVTSKYYPNVSSSDIVVDLP